MSYTRVVRLYTGWRSSCARDRKREIEDQSLESITNGKANQDRSGEHARLAFILLQLKRGLTLSAVSLVATL